MAATPQNVEMEAAKFLHKLIQESTDEPTKLATKLHVILQHMRSSGKENSMPYQVISRAMETVINRHGLDIESLMSSRQPLTGGAQAGDSSLSQIAGSSQLMAVENDSKKSLTTEDPANVATFSSKPLHGPSSAAHDIYQGSVNQLNSIKSFGSNPGSYESSEPGNPISMQFSSSYENQNAATLMHKGPAGKALEHEGFSNVMANASKTAQGGMTNNVAEMGMLRNEASRDTGKLPVLQSPSVGASLPFKEHHLKQLRAQCLVFLAFRNNLMPKKLHLEIALGNVFPKEDISSKEHIDQKGKEQSIGGQSVSHEVGMPSARMDSRETERNGPGSSSSGFISETNLLKEGEKLDRMTDKKDPTSGVPEHGEGMRNNITPRKFEAEMHPFEAKESQISATKDAVPTSVALHAGPFAVPVGEGKDFFSSQSKSQADNQGNRHGHSHLSGVPLRESWKSHPGMEGERHMMVPKNANLLEKNAMIGNNHEGEDTFELSTSSASPKFTTTEKWIADCQKRKVAADYNWAIKKKKTEQRISTRVEKLKEIVSSSEDISAKTRSVIELKKLELLNLQRRLRNEVLNDFFRPISNEMDRLKSIKKHRLGRRSKQLERYEQKMKEERQKRIRERQKDFFGDLELHKERLEDLFKFRRERLKGFNKYAREFHKRKERLHREKIDRIQREKINLLKINDVEGYLRMVQDAKSDRVKQLLKETEKYLQKLGSKLKEAKVISRCFETDMNGPYDSSEFTIESEDETDQAKHYMESNEKYYLMAHSIKETVAEQPSSLIGGKLREYQMNGLRWLLSLYNNHLNGILADEMGLGKTVQVISLLCYLMENKNDRGPFLVVVPSSVLPGWETEINFWAPSINKIVYAGPPEERRKLWKERIVQQKFNVLLTTYEYLMNKHDRPKLSKVHWHYVIIDEGHRIKNASCKLNADLKHYHSSHRLLLTGTPLQNNLEELWALLNFLLPNIFNSSEDFSQWFNKPFESNADNSLEEALLSEEENLLIINRLHQVLRPFVLRRLKHKVENELPEKIERLVRCEASAYQKLLMQRVEANLGAFGASKARAVHNSVIELRNICNHPYLSQLHNEEVHDFIPKHYLPNVIRFCGKLEMLDRLLPKLKATDHRVLLFSTMTRLLDVLEDYLYWKQYKYLRLDGHTSGGDRGALIDQFNKPGSPFFIFLLSIRAGGVGVNLQAADTVIIFDTDWNPQVDLQAQARAHRIGQKKEVLVLRLETVQTVEEQVRASAEHKLGVANQSITAGFFDNNTSAEDRREYLEALLREGKKEEAAPVLNDDGLNDLIARSESEIDVFEELDKQRQEDELAVWKNLVSEQGGVSDELIPPLPSRLVTHDELKSFCEAMKAIEVPKPLVVPGIAGKRKRELGFDTQQYGRGKRAREVRSYEEQWTEDEFEKLCQVDAPDSPTHMEEPKERGLDFVKSESGIGIGSEVAGLPMPSMQPMQIQPSDHLTVQQNMEVNPPSKRGRGRPKKNTAGISLSPMVPPVSSTGKSIPPLGIQTAPGSPLTISAPSGFKSNPSEGGPAVDTLASASNPTLTMPPGFQPTTNHPPGFQPISSPLGYQPISSPPPGFKPKITSHASLAGSQVSSSLISGPLPTPIAPPGSESTPTIPVGPMNSASPPNHNIPPAYQSNSAPYSSTISSPTLPLASATVLPFSPGSQSAISTAVTPRRGRGRGRGRPRGRGRGRGQIIESEVDVPQRRGRMPNSVVLAIPGLRNSSPVGKPEIGSPVVPAIVSETDNEPLVPGSDAINADSKAPALAMVGTPLTVSTSETSKCDIASPIISVPSTSLATVGTLITVSTSETSKSDIASPITSLPSTSLATSTTVLTNIVETMQAPLPATVSVGPQSTEVGTLSSPTATDPLGSPVSPSTSVLKQGRGRGRKALNQSETPRRRERKKDDMADAQEQKSNEPPQKKSRLSSGRKTVATRSMLRNEAQKRIDDDSIANNHLNENSKFADPLVNAFLDVNKQTSTVDNSTSTKGEKVVEPKDISVATESGSKTDDAVGESGPTEGSDPLKLINLEGERDSKLEGEESKPFKELDNSTHSRDGLPPTKCSASEDADNDNKNEIMVAENEPFVQKKTEEEDTAHDGESLEAVEADPAEKIDAPLHKASDVFVVVEENVVETVKEAPTTVLQSEIEATSSKKFEDTSQGEFKHEEKQGANDPVKKDVADIGANDLVRKDVADTDKMSSEIAFTQVEREDPDVAGTLMSEETEHEKAENVGDRAAENVTDDVETTEGGKEDHETIDENSFEKSEDVIEDGQSTKELPAAQEQTEAKPSDDMQGETIIEIEHETDSIPLEQDERGNLDTTTEAKPIETMQVETGGDALDKDEGKIGNKEVAGGPVNVEVGADRLKTEDLANKEEEKQVGGAETEEVNDSTSNRQQPEETNKTIN